MEDLGLRDPQALPGKGSAPMALPEELTMPAWLKAYNKQVPALALWLGASLCRMLCFVSVLHMCAAPSQPGIAML